MSPQTKQKGCFKDTSKWRLRNVGRFRNMSFKPSRQDRLVNSRRGRCILSYPTPFPVRQPEVLPAQKRGPGSFQGCTGQSAFCRGDKRSLLRAQTQGLPVKRDSEPRWASPRRVKSMGYGSRNSIKVQVRTLGLEYQNLDPKSSSNIDKLCALG